MSKKTSAIGKIYQALIYVFLYAPILVIGLFSFNGSANTYMLQGFSTHWYKELFSNAAAMHALQNTVVLALCTAAVSTLLGVMAAVGIFNSRHKLYKRGARPGGHANGPDLRQVGPCAQLRQHGGQGCRVVEQRVALPQTELPFLDGQKFFAIANNLSGVCVKHCQRGCVIAGVDAQRQHWGSGVSPRSRATAPNRPLTNW